MAKTYSGHFVWYEHLTIDPKAAIAFYTRVNPWTTQPFAEGGDYVMWVGSEGPLGGVMKLPEEAAKMGAPPHWVGSVQVENADATAALAKKLGATIYQEPMDIPTVGRYAVFADPQGATIAIFQPLGQEMTPPDASKEGTFGWHELITTDSAAAFPFYAELFGWKIQHEMDMGPMGTYRLYGIGEGVGAKQLGGMMNLPPDCGGQPPAWLYYVGTADLDAALARATKGGAKVLNGPMDVPDGGRIAQLLDPQGAAFALHQPAKK